MEAELFGHERGAFTDAKALRNMLEQTALLAPGNLVGPVQLAICPELMEGAIRARSWSATPTRRCRGRGSTCPR